MANDGKKKDVNFETKQTVKQSVSTLAFAFSSRYPAKFSGYNSCGMKI